LNPVICASLRTRAKHLLAVVRCIASAELIFRRSTLPLAALANCYWLTYL
jgi:hypothetical protein